jgi:hypothetical protein
MRKTPVTLFALAWSLLVAAGPAAAHHSMTMFEEDPAKRLMLSGTVVQWVWANPHCLLQIDVKGEDGQTVRWVVETSNPLDMINRGWSSGSFKAGDPVTVTVRPIKNGKPLGLIVQVQFADGRVLSASGSGSPTPAAPRR